MSASQSPESTPETTATGTPTAASGLVGFRPVIGIIAIAIGVLFLGLGAFSLVKADSTRRQDSELKEKTGGLLPPKAEDEKPPIFANTQYIWAGMLAVAGGLALLVIGITTVVGQSRAGIVSKNTDPPEKSVRVLLACAGTALGITLTAIGLVLAISWVDVLADWLGDRKQGRYWQVMAALLLFVIGLGIVFLSVQVVRIYERNSVAIRRSIYGVNLGVSLLLVLVGLVAINLVVSFKVPNRLDTTESALFTLDENTRSFLQNLKQEVTITTTATDNPNSQASSQIRRLLASCQEAAPKNIKVKYLSPTLDIAEITSLRNQYPQFDMDKLGLLFTTGPSGRATYVEAKDLYVFPSQDPRDPSGGKTSFKGEKVLVGELLLLTEDNDRTIYFTQGHGELTIGAQQPAQGTINRTGETARAALAKAQFEIKPLVFDEATTKVPDDAVVVVVADPLVTLSRNAAGALESYMNKPRANGKKGKLIVLSGPNPAPSGGGVIDTGLERLLQDYGLVLGKEYLYHAPIASQGLNANVAMAGATQQAFDQKNPIAIMIGEAAIPLTRCRTVNRVEGLPTAFQPTSLLLSYPGRPHWVETDLSANPEATWLAFRTNVSLRAAKKFSDKPDILAAAISEENKARMVVYGSGAAFADKAPEVSATTEILAVTANWLCDRPPAANIVGKPINEYRFNKATDGISLFWLPVGASLLVTIAMGLGVWVIRRK